MKSVDPIPRLTAYTSPVARCLEKAGIPAILVGDAARRGAPRTHVIGDLPHNSYRDLPTALENALLLIDAGADSVKDAQRILKEAIGIAEAGAFMVVLEHIPAALAEGITRSLRVPTMGIGAGASCDGQVLVVNDAIGLGDYWPPFSRPYAYVDRTIGDVAASFIREVRDGTFVDNVLRMKAPRKQ
jgi:3-methyl-2-oxobutanoate hydroxymethyltransferase